MATSIGSLFLELRLDTQSYQQALQNARSMALNVGKDIDRELNLRPTVNHAELTELNRHLDLKQKHFKEVQTYFDRNPLTPKVDLTQIQNARNEIAAFRKEISSLKAEASVNIKLKAQHEIDTAKFEAAIDRATRRFEKAGDDIGKKIADRVSRTKVEVKTGAFSIGGIARNIFTGFSESIGAKIAAGTSKRFDDQMAAIGRNTERYVTSRVGRAAVYASRDLGYENTRQMQKDIRRIGSFIDSFIDPKKSREGGERMEQAISNAFSNALIKKKPRGAVAKEFFQDAFEPSTGVQEAGLRLAGFGIRQVSPLIRINKDFQLAKAVQEAESMAEKIRINQQELEKMQKASSVVFSIGGFFNDQGYGAKNQMKPMMEQVMPNAYVQPVRNRYLDTAVKPRKYDELLNKIKPGLNLQILASTLGLNLAEFDAPLKMLDNAALSGISPDAIEAAARIKALKNAGLQTPIYSMGFSAGGSESSDIVRLAELMGVNIKGVGLGSPITGVAQRPQKDFLSVIGGADKLYHGFFGTTGKEPDANNFISALMSSGKMGYALSPMEGTYVPKKAGYGHMFSNYLASPEVQSKVGQFLPGTITNEIPDYFKNKKASDLSGSMALGYRQTLAGGTIDEVYKFIDLANQNRTPETIAGAIASLQEASKDFSQNFGKTKGAIKDEVKAFSKSLEDAIALFQSIQSASPEEEINAAIARLEASKQKYFALVAQNKEIERTGQKPFAFEPQRQKELVPVQPAPPPVMEQKRQQEVAQQWKEFVAVPPVKKDQIQAIVPVAGTQKEIESMKGWMAILNRGVKYAGNLQNVDPEKSQQAIAALEKDLGAIARSVEAALSQLGKQERLGSPEGNQLANLKSQISKAEQRLSEMTARMNSPAAQLSAVPTRKETAAALRSLGNSFSGEVKAIKSATSDEQAKQIATGILASAQEARAAIEELMNSLGENADNQLKKLAGTVKGQITRAEKSAKESVGNEPFEAGQDTGKGYVGGLKNQIQGVKSAANQFAKAGVDEIKQALQIKSPSRVWQYLGEMSAQGYEKGLQMLQGTPIAQYLQPLIEQAQSASKQFSMLGTGVKVAIAAFAAFPVLSAAVQFMDQMTRAVTEATLEFEKFERIINFTSGGRIKGGQAIAEVSAQAKALNVDLRSALQGYAQFSASTRETPLEGRATQQIFGAVTQASGVMGLDVQSQERVFLALSQMSSKSVISMEELRQQLGEALPGAMNIAARSMNMTTQEFNALVSSGQLLATDFLPKFSSQLKAETSTGLSESAKSTQASITRLNNAIFELQVTAGKGLLPGTVFINDTLAAGINFLTQNVGLLLNAFTALTLYISVTMLQKFGLIPASMGAIAQSIKSVVAAINLQNLTSMFTGFGGKISAAMTPMMNFTGKLALITAGIMALSEAYDLLRDRGGSARESADRMRDSLEALQKTLGNQQKPQGQEGLFGFRTGNKYADRALTESGKDPWWMQIAMQTTGLGAFGSIKAGYDSFKADKTTADTKKAVGELLKTGGGIQGQANDLMGRSATIATLNQIEKSLNDNQLRMRSMRSQNPGNAAGLRQLQEEYDRLIKMREDLSKPFDEAKAAIASYVATLKSQISEYSDNPQYAEQVKRLKAELERAEQAQSDLNRSVESNLSVLQKFERAWQRISDRAEGAIQASKDALNVNNAAVGNALAAGDITPGQANSMRQVNARSQIATDIATRQRELEALKAEFEKISGSQYLAAYNMSLNSSAKELAGRGERLTAPQEKKAFESAARIKEIESEIKVLDSSLADSASTISESLRDASKAVTDFARGIARQVEDINATVKQQSLEIKSSNLKAKIDEALTGVQSTFVDGLVGAIVDFANTTTQKGQNLLNAINAGRNTMRQIEDTQLNAAEMMRNQPGYGGVGNTVGGVSGFKAIEKIYKDHFIDDSPIGSYDFTLERGGQVNVGIPSPVSGVVTQAGTMGGYGNVVAVKDEATGMEWFMAHLEKVGVKAGERVVKGMELGIQGSTGRSSGEHVHAEIWNKPYSEGGQRITNRAVTRPMMEAYLQFLQRGSSGVANNIAPTGRATGGINLQTFFQGGSNSLAAKVIGMAEGNRTASGGFTAHAQGHTDPGNGAFNIGSFSAQGSLNRGSIAASDEAVINELLKPYADRLAQQASRVGVQVTPKLLLNYLDTLNQGGAQVVTGWNDSTKGAGFLGKLGMIRGRENDDAAIRQLRVESYRNTSGRLETTFASEEALARDQQRRMGELNAAASAFGLAGGGGILKPTTGMTNADIKAAEQASQLNLQSAMQVNASLAELQNAASIAQKSELDLANARNRELDAGATRRLIDATASTRKSAEDEAIAARGRREAMQDQLRGVGYETPEREYQNRLQDVQRRTRDTAKELERAIEQNQASLKTLDEAQKSVLEQMKSSSMPDKVGKQVLEGIEASRNSVQTALRENQKAQSELKKVQDQQIKDAAEKRDLKIAQRKQEFDGRFAAQQAEQMKLEAEMLKTMGIDPGRAISLQDEAQRIEIKNSTAEQILGFQEAARQSGMAEEEIQKLIAGFKKLEDLKLENVTLQTRKLRQELEIMQKEQIFDSLNKVADAEIEGFRIIGMDRFAKDIEREKALAQERFNLSQEMKRVNDMGLDDETKSQVTANIDRAHAKKIDNIKRQFSVLNEIIANNKGAFQDFFTGLLNGTESFGSAFSKMVQSIANNLASMASDFLTNELMGILTGKNRMANQKDAKDLMGNVSPAVTYDGQGRELSIAAENAGTQFVGLTQQAGQQIIAAAEAFNQIVSTGGFSSIDGGNLPIRMMDFTGDAAGLPGFTTAIDTSSSKLFESAQNASFSILDGVQIASDYLADAGTGTSDNLLSGLSKGLPGILQSVLGSIGGGSAGGGFGGIIGSLVSPLLGGLFGGGGGDIMGGLAIDLGSPVVPMLKNGGFVPNFAKGGFSSDDRAFMNGSLFKGANPIAQAVRREGSGAIVGVMNKDEYILTPSETQIFFALGFDKIVKGRTPNFRMGGGAGGNMGNAARFTRGQEVSITVPVTVSDGSSVNPQKLAESIRGAVQNEIAKQQRPGGQLY